MARYIGLLRAINVAGKHRLPMADLRALFSDAGAQDVQTYIQSGNVVFSAPAAVARRLPAEVATAIEDGFGFSAPVVVRSASQLRKVIERDPFPPARRDDKLHHVGFLAERPSKGLVAALDPDRSPGDEFAVVGTEVYVCYAKGAGTSKLTTAWFDHQLGTTSTFRNWRTVTTLLELATG